MNSLSQFMQNSRECYLQAAHRLLKYLHGTSRKGILFKKSTNLEIEGYCDADWAGDVNDRKSTSGYCCLIGKNLVSWKSKKQQVVTRSNAKAEYRSMAEIVSELLWLKQLQSLSFKTDKPMKLYSNSKYAICICKNLMFHERTKHIKIDCHFLREKVQASLISAYYISSKWQPIDLLTKSSNRDIIERLCN